MPHPAPITLYSPAIVLARKADCSALSALPQSLPPNRPQPESRLLRAFSAPAIVSLQSSSTGKPIAPRYRAPAIASLQSSSVGKPIAPRCRAPAIVSLQSSLVGKPIAPRFQRSRNRFLAIALDRNADCSALPRSRNRFLAILLARKADCSALPRSRNRFLVIVRSRKADCSALSALPQSPEILATRPAPAGRVALLRVSPCLPYVRTGRQASLPLCPVAWQGFPLTLYQPSRISAIFLGLVIQI